MLVDLSLHRVACERSRVSEYSGGSMSIHSLNALEISKYVIAFLPFAMSTEGTVVKEARVFVDEH